MEEARRALLGFVPELQERRGNKITTAALDGKTLRGVGEDGEQLKALHGFRREGLAALDQVAIASHLDEPRAAREWIETVAARGPGLTMLTADALDADADLAQPIVDQPIVAQGKDYTFKLKKPTATLQPATLQRRGLALLRRHRAGLGGKRQRSGPTRQSTRR